LSLCGHHREVTGHRGRRRGGEGEERNVLIDVTIFRNNNLPKEIPPSSDDIFTRGLLKVIEFAHRLSEVLLGIRFQSAGFITILICKDSLFNLFLKKKERDKDKRQNEDKVREGKRDTHNAETQDSGVCAGEEMCGGMKLVEDKPGNLEHLQESI
jgi:hypothetical protein